MIFNAAGNPTKFNSVSRFWGGLASSTRLAALAVALAAFVAVGGCGQTGGSGGPNSAQLSPSASGVTFGNVTVGSSTSQLVTLTAAGGKSVTIASVTASGTGFVVSPKSNVVLAPSQSLTISVSFQPKSTGSATGQLLVASNASNSKLKIALSGDGVTGGNHSVTLNWRSSASAVAGYFVFRGSSANSLAQLSPGAVPSTTYTDKTIANGQTYVYAVKSIGSGNVLSAYSNYVTVSVPAN
jgi:Abnormal spindle-like microcephaly-assoc'd, ASPM-SPD-2-Hydin